MAIKVSNDERNGLGCLSSIQTNVLKKLFAKRTTICGDISILLGSRWVALHRKYLILVGFCYFDRPESHGKWYAIPTKL